MSSKWNIYYHKYIALYSLSPPPPANPNMIHYLQTSYLGHLSPLSCLTSAISWNITTVLLASYNSQNIDHGQRGLLAAYNSRVLQLFIYWNNWQDTQILILPLSQLDLYLHQDPPACLSHNIKQKEVSADVIEKSPTNDKLPASQP